MAQEPRRRSTRFAPNYQREPRVPGVPYLGPTERHLHDDLLNAWRDGQNAQRAADVAQRRAASIQARMATMNPELIDPTNFDNARRGAAAAAAAAPHRHHHHHHPPPHPPHRRRDPPPPLDLYNHPAWGAERFYGRCVMCNQHTQVIQHHGTAGGAEICVDCLSDSIHQDDYYYRRRR